jgi:hypothetical protein
MERRAIDLSDEETDVSLSLSSYDLDNGPGDGGYENVAQGAAGAEKQEDGYEGYVLSGELRGDDESSSETDDELPESGRRRDVAGDELSVGSGSMVSALQLRSAVQRGLVFSQQLSEAKRRRDRESVQEQLERALALQDSTPDESTRKFSLVLELVRNRLDEWAKHPPPSQGGQQPSSDPVTKWSAALCDV